MDNISKKKKPQTSITGGCFCGLIKYKIEGKLRDARSCHCPDCRKAFSAQASAYALVNPDEFSWVSGKTLLTIYKSKKGEGLQFCSICGSTLTGTLDGNIHGVTLGCVNDDPDIEIGMHIYVGSKANWEIIPDGVIKYQEAPPENI
ncbi:MAG: GFA family protein [Bacteroidales bacterium]|jgi:hypothetical protein|nr:GFA family protein [Bacteroidales bacterium]